MSIAEDMLKLNECCVERHFARPILDEIRSAGGVESIRSGSVLFNDLSQACCMKTSNVEIECNFARASSMRAAMRGRAHAISSLTSKHISAEIKLAQRRKIASSDPAKLTKKDSLPRTSANLIVFL